MLDWNKPIQTRDGRKLEVLTMKRNTPDGELPVVLLQTENDGYQRVVYRNIHGRVYNLSDCDVVNAVNVVKKTSRWVNCYSDSFGNFSTSREACDAWGRRRRRLGVLRVDYEDGIPVNSCIEPIS